MSADKSDVLQGTLDLLVLKTLALGPMHGYGIAKRIQQISRDELRVNQGSLYPALVKLQQRGWITAEWGASEKNRRAKYYSLTPAGTNQLDAEAQSWKRFSTAIGRVLRAQTAEGE